MENRYDTDMLIARCAQRALLYEVSVSPKPGLVDRFDSGAHNDMDIFTFIDSAVVLPPYFTACAAVGRENARDGADTLLVRLRPLGLEAEREMLAATNGVNTHKGAIFLLGFLCAAAGRVGFGRTGEELCALAGEIAAPALQDYRSMADRTTGERLYRTEGCLGVRGEAAGGFPSVLRYALPLLREAERSGASLNNAGVRAILSLIRHVEDTTMIKRCGGERQMHERREREFAQYAARSPLRTAELMNEVWSADGISAGGCADLLGAAFFLLFYERTEDFFGAKPEKK